MRIIDTDVKHHCFGTIKYQTLEIRIKNPYNVQEQITNPKESFSVIEELWFNEEDTGRKVTILD